MRTVVPVSKTVALAVVANFLSALTGIFGAAPFMALYRVAGLRRYLIFGAISIGALSVGGVFDRALIVLTVFVLVAVFSEFKRRGAAMWSASFAGILVSSGVAFIAFALWCLHGDLSPRALLESRIDSVLHELKGQQINFSKEGIVFQFPSAVVICLSLSLWLALIFESSFRRAFGFIEAFDLERTELTLFRVPDEISWLVVLSTAGTFVDFGPPALRIVSSNVFNVLVVLYFFQGLSIVAYCFDRLKTGLLWRSFVYFVLISYLFPAVSIVGLIDYWVDFRVRFSRKSQETI